MDDILTCICSSLNDVIDRINAQLFEDDDGRDYLSWNIERILNLVAHAAALFQIPEEVELLLHEARRKLSSTVGGSVSQMSRCTSSTGCRGRPSLVIPCEQLELYLEYRFSVAKIAKMFCVSTKTVFRRIRDYGLERKLHSALTEEELDAEM